MTRGIGQGVRRVVIALVAIGLSGCMTNYRVKAGTGRVDGVAAVARGLSNAALARLVADMDPAMLALARRHDPAAGADPWGRVVGWTSYDLARIPTLGDLTLESSDALLINALKPYGDEPTPPARPFILKASTEDRARAEDCLTQAIYYEAAVEPVEGMQAVAQTVLNRLRHPGYPKSVCGVVYEGSQRLTGCQFSFTCDGSLARTPNPVLWARARGVAHSALGGFVLAPVGTATHYHADYVAPYWAPTLYKITKIGRHIFYRWTGPSGSPAAFSGRYAGGENNLSLAILQGLDERIQGSGLTGDARLAGPATRTVTLAVAGESRTYAVQIPDPAGGQGIRIEGALQPARRPPTPAEVAEINARLKRLDEATAPPRPAQAAPPTLDVTAGNLPLARPN
ncbi:MAG: cell wall hydrolase [Caulobacter sp.]|nr:cell wall hydrolase [Caulobacter sp.]